MVALAKHLGPNATADLVKALSDRSGTVRDYAMNCLAEVGDEGAWNPVLSHFQQLLKRPATGGATARGVCLSDGSSCALVDTGVAGADAKERCQSFGNPPFAFPLAVPRNRGAAVKPSTMLRRANASS